jgi:hypothetical protein
MRDEGRIGMRAGISRMGEITGFVCLAHGSHRKSGSIDSFDMRGGWEGERWKVALLNRLSHNTMIFAFFAFIIETGFFKDFLCSIV